MSVVETKCVLCELGSEFYLSTVPHAACTFFVQFKSSGSLEECIYCVTTQNSSSTK